MLTIRRMNADVL